MKVSAVCVLALAGATTAQNSDLVQLDIRGQDGGIESHVHRKPFVVPSTLIREVDARNLVNHANQFVKFSKLSNGTRAFGSKGHNATVQYIKGLLDRTNAYTTEYQTFQYLYSEGNAAFSANGTDYTTAWFTYGPAGDVTAPLQFVAGVGCELVCRFLCDCQAIC